MRFSSISGNSIGLDGGAMFGNAPRLMWEKWISPDPYNRINLSTRALLVETGDSKILFETGSGSWMNPEMRKRYGIIEDHNILIESLREVGLSHTDITDVIISHLHFDHSGGLLSDWADNRRPELLFPNARIIISKQNWARSQNPHDRDRASFIPFLNRLISESGRFLTIEDGQKLNFKNIEITFRLFNGHTPGMICSDLIWDNGEMLFAADLIPGVPWVRTTITMGYDRFPELLIDEKSSVLKEAAQRGKWIFYTHDTSISASMISENEKGFTVINEKGCFKREIF